MKTHLRFFVFLLATALYGAAPVYVMLWFDTEDYVDPRADDAALRIANDLTALEVRGTFKIVGEKARVLESRKRRDVIRALSRHSIGYHSNYHSIHPAPAEYLRRFNYLEGADEFARREGSGVADIRRIFGVTPVCYGQPGSSWGPQSNLGLRKLGIPIYLDEASQVGLGGQPFWYGGLLYVFNMKPNQLRARLDAGPEDKEAYTRFDQIAGNLRTQGGGVISIYYHPTEFVNTEFWDAVNFSRGANPPRSDWKKPHSRTQEEAERCYGVLRKFVEHMKSVPDVQFVTASDLQRLFRPQTPVKSDRKAIAEHLRKQITFLDSGEITLSPADMVLQLLGVESAVVDGPAAKGATTFRPESIPQYAFEASTRDAADFIRRNHRLPNEVFVGAETLSLADFAATLAASVLEPSDPVRVVRGNIQFEKHFSTEPAKSFDWVIHPAGFQAPELLEMGRLQGWTLKPARLVSSVPRRKS